MTFLFAVLPILLIIIIFLLVDADDKKKWQKINNEKKERELSSYKLVLESQRREESERLAKIKKTDELIEKAIDMFRMVCDKYASFSWYKGGENSEIQGVVKGVKITLYIEKKLNDSKWAKHDNVSVFVHTKDSVQCFPADIVSVNSIFNHLEKLNDTYYVNSLMDGDDPREDYFL